MSASCSNCSTRWTRRRFAIETWTRRPTSSSSTGAASCPAPLRSRLIVHLSRRPATPEEVTSLRQAVREYFALSASHVRTQLRQLFREGRWSLLIGVLFLGVAIVLGDLLIDLAGRWDYGEILAHSLLIGGWVALWRPFEIFLYEWWPILGEARLYDRLSAMQVQVVNETR